MLPGETGEVVACESPETLAPALASLLLNPLRLETMGRAARDHVTARFDWKSLAAQAATVFAGGSIVRPTSKNGRPTLETQQMS
jgi:glycosyltransferase involved in cell wall biosynthesis